MSENKELEKITAIIYREIKRIIFDIEDRKDILFKLWTKERLRTPLLRVLRNRYDDMKFEYLIKLPKDLAIFTDDFYNFLDKFIFYISYTEDMPHTMQENFNIYTKELIIKANTLLKELLKTNPSLKDDILNI